MHFQRNPVRAVSRTSQGAVGQLGDPEARWWQQQTTLPSILWFPWCLQNSATYTVTYKQHNMHPLLLQSSLFFSFCSCLLRSLSLTVTRPLMVFGNHCSLPSSREELGTIQGGGRSNNHQLRNHEKKTTQPGQGTLRGREESYPGKKKGTLGFLRVHEATS